MTTASRWVTRIPEKKTGGRINCKAFTRNFLITLVELPIKNIVPVFLKNSHWNVALPLEPIQWEKQEFSKSGVNQIPKDAVGVYELLGNGDAVLRVGEGKIKERMNSHLIDKRFAPPTVKAFRYVVLDEVEDGKILEDLRIEEVRERNWACCHDSRRSEPDCNGRFSAVAART